jgi:PAS domain S-box-containing protein
MTYRRNTVILFDPIGTLEAELAGQLVSGGFGPRVVRDPQDLVRAMNNGSGPAILADLDQAPVLHALQHERNDHEEKRAWPLIVIADQDDFDTRVRAVRTGAQQFFPRPVKIDTLGATLREFRNRNRTSPYRVLVVEDDPAQAEWVELTLLTAGMSVRHVSDPRALLDAVRRFGPDVILMDVPLPGCDGIELAVVVRQYPEFAHIPITFLTVENSANRRRVASMLDAGDFLPKPIEAGALVSAVTVRAERSRDLQAATHRAQRTMQEMQHQKMAIDQHAIVSMADMAGNIVYANDKFCEISGYSRAELIGQNHRLIKSGFHPKEFFVEMWRTIRAGKVWQGVICNRSKDGQLYWVESTIAPFLDANGVVDRYVSMRTDVTKIVHTEEELRAARDRITHLVKSSPTVLYELAPDDAQMSLRWVSENITRLTGYTVEESLQPGWWVNNLHPQDREAVMAGLPALDRDGGLAQEYRFQFKDGSYHWIADNLRITSAADGRTEQIIGSWTDIHGLRSAQEAVRQSEERLRYSQAFANIGTWDWNIQTGGMFWSERVAPLFGYSTGDLETTYGNFLLAVHPDDRELVVEAINECVESSVEYSIEHRIVWPDGAIRWAQERGDVIRDAEGRPVRMLGVVQDITRRKMIEQELLRASREADRANRAKSQFLSSMSHELRTPLNAILGFAQLLEADPANPLSPMQKEGNDQIINAGWHLLELINEVLDLSRIETGNIQLSPEGVGVHELLHDCLQLIQPLAVQHAVTLTDRTQMHDDLQVYADRTRLRQVLLNLLSNAVKYNRTGGSVTLDWQQIESDELRIMVTDTGSGMSPEQLTHLFEPFNRLGREGENVEGTGIGLVITQRLMQMMGGSVGVKSEPGAGSTFWVDLPLSNMQFRVLPAPPQNALVADKSTEQRAGQQTILYIEDNPINLRLVEQVISRETDLRLISAPSGELGLSLARSRHPRLILLDINLPGMDGYTVFKALQNHPETADIPVVGVSANAMSGDMRRAVEAGFHRYLTKPLDVQEFLVVIRESLEKSDNGAER